MVVFSDLDRSIIYSKRFLGEDKSELEIEIYKNENISYISKKTVELIKQIKAKIEFIPTSTRSIEQFKRIEFSKYDIDFKYAITSNGGNILVNGQIDSEYKDYINQKLKNSIHIDEIMKLLKEYKNINGIKKIRKADNIFVYIVVDNKIFDLKYIELFINKIKDLNWETYINGTKIYFLPKELKKSTAIKYICDKFNYKNTFAIGDSIMDKDMLDFCKNSYLLKHGDLVNSLGKENKYLISKECGFRGSEEVLKHIISYKKNTI